MSLKTGINEEKIRMLCIDIQNYMERLAVIFNQLDQVVDENKSSYLYDSSLEFFNKYESLRNSYKVINNNLFSYINDFNNLVNAFNNLDQEQSKKIQNATDILLSNNEGSVK